MEKTLIACLILAAGGILAGILLLRKKNKPVDYYPGTKIRIKDPEKNIFPHWLAEVADLGRDQDIVIRVGDLPDMKRMFKKDLLPADALEKLKELQEKENL